MAPWGSRSMSVLPTRYEYWAPLGLTSNSLNWLITQKTKPNQIRTTYPKTASQIRSCLGINCPEERCSYLWTFPADTSRKNWSIRDKDRKLLKSFATILKYLDTQLQVTVSTRKMYFWITNTGFFEQKIKMSTRILTYIYTLNSFPWAGCDTRSIFKWSLTGLNSEFSFSYTSCHTKSEELS